MPTYRYRCDDCDDEFEVWQSITDDALTTHEGCGGALKKVLSPAGIVLKGSGFYKTDSRSGSGNGRGAKKEPEKKADSGSSDSGSGTGSSDSGTSTPKDASKSGSSSSSGGSS